MRADRLVSMVLLLRQRGRMTADELAAELEVSARTVQRDIEALSAAGVPVYSDRGRHGGYSLLPGFRTELTALNHDEALALAAAGAGARRQVFGLGPALATAMRKVIDALPETNRDELGDATRRILVEPGHDLLSRPTATDPVDDLVMHEVRRAVLQGLRIRFRYASPDRAPRSHVVDPIGLVTVDGVTYLLATKAGADRTYRLSRVSSARVLSEPAVRADDVDLAELWRQRRARFLADDQLIVRLLVEPGQRERLVRSVRSVRAEHTDADGRLALEVVFDDLRHAVWAVWQLDVAAEVVAPPSLRAAITERVETLAARYR